MATFNGGQGRPFIAVGAGVESLGAVYRVTFESTFGARTVIGQVAGIAYFNASIAIRLAYQHESESAHGIHYA